MAAEVQGHTSEPGLDTDTTYGQLLRRMGASPEPGSSYALVVPAESLRSKAERVAARVREKLRIEGWLMPDEVEPFWL